MIKYLISYLFILALTLNGDLNTIRVNYKEAVKSKTATFALQQQLESVTKNQDKRLVAYKGAVISLTARYLKGSKLKKETFKKGVDLIEYSISKEPTDIEIRFIRLSVQQNSPKFLGYNKNIETDINFIFQNFNQIQSVSFKNYLKEYILTSEKFTETQKNSIR